MLSNRSSFGLKPILYERYEISDRGPISACPESPKEGRVCAGEIVIFEGLFMILLAFFANDPKSHGVSPVQCNDQQSSE